MLDISLTGKTIPQTNSMYTIMKTQLYSLLILLSLVATAQNEVQKFKSTNGIFEASVLGKWEAAGNMNGIELFLFRSSPNHANQIITISAENNLLNSTDLNAYIARKVALQTSVLNATIMASDDAEIDGLHAKVITYSYYSSDMENRLSKVMFIINNDVAYQITFTAQIDEFNQSIAIFNEFQKNLRFL